MSEHEAPGADGVETSRPSCADGASSDPFTRSADEPDTAEGPAAAGPASKPSRATRIVGFGAAAVVLLGIGAGGGALAAEGLQTARTPTAATGTTNGFGHGPSGSSGSSGSAGSSGGFGSDSGPFGGFGPQGGFGSGSSSGSGGSAGSATTATAAQQAGVVTVVSMLGYQSGEAAGTGIILSSNGEILTNNHVIDGSTAIRVTVESTGKTYRASVVGTDATDDIAVLQLKGASGLTTASIATTPAAVGDTVTAVGNAGGTGTLSAATGTVTDLNQSITTQAEGASASESLTGLIETDADIVSGDSGGPLENAAGRVVGIDTAASSGTSQVTGFAIPISTAVHIAGEITSGSTSSSITLGLPAFLGVEVSGAAAVDGAGVAQALPNTPAAAAGLEGGDVITAVNGRTIHSADALTSRLHAYSPGDTVSLTYTDANGASHTVHVTLTTGPAN
ncbi:MAG TPA: trypsin-like peptidase domain-containing protein [Amnibacterium sp.]|nr:trypsin-like peptidase domain-containing protein [Amnibacterium sp.]